MPFIQIDAVKIKNLADEHMHPRGNLDYANHSGHPANLVMSEVLKHQTAFARILAMPNAGNHIKTQAEVATYKAMMYQRMPKETEFVDINFTISLKPETTPEIIEELEDDVTGVKYYPGGVTTGSGDASKDLDITNPNTRAVFEAIIKKNKERKLAGKKQLNLLLHPETTLERDQDGMIKKGFVHNAEREFMGIIVDIARDFRDLPIVVEHISTKEMAYLVSDFDTRSRILYALTQKFGSRYAQNFEKQMGDIIVGEEFTNISASVTPQHLLFTAHEKEGGHAFDPHLHCKPTLKEPADLIAVQTAVLSGGKNIFYGSDSAAHPKNKVYWIDPKDGQRKLLLAGKECEHCASGVVSSTTGPQEIIEWLTSEKTHALWENLTSQDMTVYQKQILMQQFFSDNGARVHGRYTDDFTKTTTYKRKKNKIPLSYTAGMDVDGNDIDIVPMRAGKELQFEINEVAIETKAGVQLILSTDHFGLK